MPFVRRLAPLLAAVLVAGCGGSSHDAASSTTSAASTTTAAATTSDQPTTTTTVQAVANDPAALAAQISAVERTLRDPTTSPEDAERTGTFQQLAYRRLSSHPEWDQAFMAAVAPDVVPAVANNLAAFRAFQRPPHGPASDTLPAWQILQPLPADQLLSYYHEAEAATGVPWYYLASINLVETRMGRIHGLSTAGAQGPMQFLPSTWAACCTGNIEDAHDAILGAATYLKMSGAPANMDKAILAYNHDTRYLDAIKAYAANMASDERAYLGYHAWEVFYASSAGSFRLPVGYDEPTPVPVADAATTAAEPS
ncbi:MAG TPA: lytic transglycosylase domain-containing protein [Acidimicrobiales bacterium]|nr:lytic transglycosylase domain-containing protein [Acidimicrobiales bacterium]